MPRQVWWCSGSCRSKAAAAAAAGLLTVLPQLQLKAFQLAAVLGRRFQPVASVSVPASLPASTALGAGAAAGVPVAAPGAFGEAIDLDI